MTNFCQVCFSLILTLLHSIRIVLPDELRAQLPAEHICFHTSQLANTSVPPCQHYVAHNTVMIMTGSLHRLLLCLRKCAVVLHYKCVLCRLEPFCSIHHCSGQQGPKEVKIFRCFMSPLTHVVCVLLLPCKMMLLHVCTCASDWDSIKHHHCCCQTIASQDKVPAKYAQVQLAVSTQACQNAR